MENRSVDHPSPHPEDAARLTAQPAIPLPRLFYLVFAVGVSVGGLFLISRYNFLLFHGLAEIFSIAVAWGVFMLVWNARRLINNDALVFLGTAYLFIGLIDLLHTLAYKGMGVFAGHVEANLATQLWIAGRYLEGFSLLAFACLIGKSFRANSAFFIFSIATAVLLASILVWPVFPACFISGSGLTPFKKISEYVICLVLAAALAVLYRKRAIIDADVFGPMVVSIGLTIVGELAFTFYVSVYGFSNMVGHLAKIGSFFLIYVALIRSGLIKPYAVLFSKWKHSQAQLIASEEKFARAFYSSPLLMSISSVDDGVYLDVNDAFVQMTGYSKADCLGRTSVQIGVIDQASRQRFKDILMTERRVDSLELNLRKKDGTPMICRYWGEFIQSGGRTRLLSTALDITREKRTEQERQYAIELLRARLALSRYADTHSLDDVLKRTLDEAEKLTGSRIGFFHFIDADQQTIRLQMWSTNTTANICKANDLDRHYPIENAGVWGDCIRERRPIIHNDYGRLPYRKGLPKGHAPIVRELTIPVLRDNQVVAVLGVGNKPSDYTREDIAMAGELVNMAWDIVARQRAEKDLIESRRDLQTLVGNLPGMAFRCTNNADWTMQYISDGCRELTGYDAGDLIGNYNLAFNDIIHPDDRQAVWDRIQTAIEVGEEYQIEYRIVDRQGTQKWVWERGRFVEDAGGRHSFLEGFISDITRRRQREDELHQLASAIDQAAESVVITDADGHIVFVNPSFERVTGYRSPEVIGKTPRLLKSGRQDARFYDELWSTITAGRIWTGRFVNRRKDGSFYIEKGKISPVFGRDGKIINFVAVKNDVTDEIRLEENLRQAQKMEAIGTLAGGIAHDFNNILFPMLGFTELLQEDLPADSPLQEYASNIMSAAMRARDLVQQILAFSRQTDQKRHVIRVQHIIKETIKLIRAGLPSSIAVKQKIDPNCLPVLADPTQIHQIAMNLITNAFHAMETGGGALTVVLEMVDIPNENHRTVALDPGRHICLKVSDTGSGIDPAIINRIFDPYFTTKGEGKGTGMGLSVIHGIVNACHGDIQVESRAGRGATFAVYLPCVDLSTEGSPDAGSEPIPGGDEHILLVDDEVMIVDMISMILNRLGYQVTARTAGIEALEVFRADPHRFDLVITDLTMPNITGDRLIRELKNIRANIPVILCTGFSQKLDAQQSAEIGVDGLVLKPILQRDLANVIRQVLDHPDDAVMT